MISGQDRNKHDCPDDFATMGVVVIIPAGVYDIIIEVCLCDHFK